MVSSRLLTDALAEDLHLPGRDFACLFSLWGSGFSRVLAWCFPVLQCDEYAMGMQVE